MLAFNSLVGTLLAIAVSTQLTANAFVVGEVPGFAAGTTGGGTAEPVYPKDLQELETFLGDEETRVIVLDKEFDFLGSNGTTTEQGCRPKIMEECIAENNGFEGQDVILREGDTTFTETGGCDQAVGVEVTYDNAAKNPLVVKGDKTLRGIGQAGVIKGRGLWLNGDNIIIQNIHITELNPKYVWGGDAIYIQGTEAGSMKNIWLDHIKISRVGRQMLVIAFGGAESLTISNSDFDGRTDWSSSCDGRHYWAFIIGGEPTHVTFMNNYVHSTSGRSPKIISEMGTNPIVVGHIVNNYWADNSGHSFEPGLNAFVLAEGNLIQDTVNPILADEKATIFTAADSNDCSSYLGRACVANVLENSGPLDSVNGEGAMERVKEFKEISGYTPGAAEKLVEASDNFGIGGLEDGAGSTSQQNPIQAESDAGSAALIETEAPTEEPVPAASEAGSPALNETEAPTEKPVPAASEAGSAAANTTDAPSPGITAPSTPEGAKATFKSGEAPGFAAGTTGGGTAEPVYPKDLQELETFLGDEETRVIVLDKEFDFLGSNGTTTEQGCRPKIMEECIAENNGFEGQDVILREGDTTFTETGGCDQAVGVEVTYDNAAKNPLVVKGDKTLRGIGQAGVIKGRGLWLNGDNIIIQNIHITELNPKYVWGGDAIYIQGTEAGSMKNIWLDHIKISRVGRQMLVIAFGGAESLTISNSDFDGRTDWSSSCDGRHYWAFIIGGEPTHVTFMNNYVHSTSGRSPKIISEMGTNPIVVGHIVNNYWADNSGHSFEPGLNAFVLAEGNFIQDTVNPILADEKATIFTAADSNDCSSYLGRACVANVLENSGPLDSVNGEGAMERVKEFKEISGYTPGTAAKLKINLENFGVGLLQATTNDESVVQDNTAAEDETIAPDEPVVQDEVAKDYEASESVATTSTCKAKRRA